MVGQQFTTQPRTFIVSDYRTQNTALRKEDFQSEQNL